MIGSEKRRRRVRYMAGLKTRGFFGVWNARGGKTLEKF